MENKYLTLGSLFDGSGGFPLAGILAGIAPVWNSEIEPFPVRVTEMRLPGVKHYGDVSKLKGSGLEPVDIITFGSPCQDMSLAGKREGLDGKRSGLFFDAIRIIKEMREETHGKYPRYAVWENVPGAFSSNGGEDFRAVLSEFVHIKDEAAAVPVCKKWNQCGLILGDGFSVAWRMLDAQYWGVPQRRKRIYLVADFASGRAGEILFESEGVSGYSAEGFKAWQRAAGNIENGTGESGGIICLNPQGRSGVAVTREMTDALIAQDHGHHPAVLQAAGFCTEHSADSRGIGYEDEKSPTLRAGVVPGALLFENHMKDARYTGPKGVGDTVTARYGTGGKNQPLVLNSPKAYGISSDQSHAMLSGNPHAGIYEAETSRTLDGNGGSPSCNQGGTAVVSPVYEASKGSYFMDPHEDVADALLASDYKDPPLVNGGQYIVRRLTPVECARLQGFPDWWCDGLSDPDPSGEEIQKWMEIFETHRIAIGKDTKPKTRAQVIKWLKDPYTDSAAYRMWGNGICLSNAYFVLSGIVWADRTEA